MYLQTRKGQHAPFRRFVLAKRRILPGWSVSWRAEQKTAIEVGSGEYELYPRWALKSLKRYCSRLHG